MITQFLLRKYIFLTWTHSQQIFKNFIISYVIPPRNSPDNTRNFQNLLCEINFLPYVSTHIHEEKRKYAVTGDDRDLNLTL